ncbi:hypothetical protein A2714_00690 [Candidatus Woesebacteria bacterium RIFCSPHIGHO2_01_FULL_38_9]|uniref:LytR/CpsA/Psr regulator C-terminal domain-containing protein n=1 Tax=Candidatus Woesebacteria bacterium RIFCSPHIGHO2_01_FULL_38_9 TaxID=1802492 RepID=A0A1F7Y2X9_9BACT|nr:MAG: hypothetical protein A2714_00690 [Candidatus Woesebacteria bacterium RIFCSPHIGHO2_01_FULL_38_9]
MDAEGQKIQETSNLGDNPQRTQVGFPQTSRPKKSPLKIIIILIILAGLGFGAWYVFKGRASTEESSEVSPTPTTKLTPTPTEVPIERENVKIQVLNGTGLSGAAGNLKKELEELGYSKLDVGNASPQNFKVTQVVFSDTVLESVKDEIQEKLEEIYQDVEAKEGDAGNHDIQISTGYPKGYTPSPTPKVTSTPKPTSGITGTPTLTPVTTPTLTPTLTPTP